MKSLETGGKNIIASSLIGFDFEMAETMVWGFKQTRMSRPPSEAEAVGTVRT